MITTTPLPAFESKFAPNPFINEGSVVATRPETFPASTHPMTSFVLSSVFSYPTISDTTNNATTSPTRTQAQQLLLAPYEDLEAEELFVFVGDRRQSEVSPTPTRESFTSIFDIAKENGTDEPEIGTPEYIFGREKVLTRVPEFERHAMKESGVDRMQASFMTRLSLSVPPQASSLPERLTPSYSAATNHIAFPPTITSICDTPPGRYTSFAKFEVGIKVRHDAQKCLFAPSIAHRYDYERSRFDIFELDSELNSFNDGYHSSASSFKDDKLNPFAYTAPDVSPIADHSALDAEAAINAKIDRLETMARRQPGVCFPQELSASSLSSSVSSCPNSFEKDTMKLNLYNLKALASLGLRKPMQAGRTVNQENVEALTRLGQQNIEPQRSFSPAGSSLVSVSRPASSLSAYSQSSFCYSSCEEVLSGDESTADSNSNLSSSYSRVKSHVFAPIPSLPSKKAATMQFNFPMLDVDSGSVELKHPRFDYGGEQLTPPADQPTEHIVIDLTRKPTSYLYEGGSSTVLPGGVMLGNIFKGAEKKLPPNAWRY
ncbi:hypothetical protein BDQ12DRAFT_760284 [Crucibulum laeve]|uniref:Uncharacterized protein n=1 Tax=Crucibulum laeve TaxID=68775 RepID=A0A5C3LT29_9AGAR|nr:hypothetical protein BDQ12DRAFT_760284 [Crucibulum laeve]